jgi:hypothetical protein
MKTGKLVVVASGSRSQRVSDVAERVRAYESNHPRFS